MKIRSITATPMRYAEPNDFMRVRMTVLVRIDTDEGVAGWGEGIAMWPEACKATKIIAEEGFGPLIIGKDPADVEAHWLA